MTDLSMIHPLMLGLIERAGGPERAASMIDARMGRPLDRDSQSTRKGTMSKRMSGQYAWPADEILALEDVLGVYPYRDWLRQCTPQVEEGASMMSLLSEAARESGEGLSAIVQVLSGGGCPAQARKELVDAISAFQRLKLALSGDVP